MKRRLIVLIFSSIAAMMALSACGQKGPLRLPDPPKAESLRAVVEVR
jgi:predicted small lipoprotein YifL